MVRTEMISKLRTNKLLLIIFSPIIALRRAYLVYKNRHIKYYNKLFSNVSKGSLLVTINNISGVFEIDSRSHILQRILINKNYEHDIALLIRKSIRVDKDVINIGANIGIFTILMADLINKGNRVLAVEPTPLAFKYLVNNVNRNKLNNKVISFNGICTDKHGEYELNTILGKEEYSSLGESYYASILDESVYKINVTGETVNCLVNNFYLDPGLILIDVEGAEMKVLAGSTEIIKKHKPIIILESIDKLLIKQGTSTKEIIDFLANLGYDVRNIHDNAKINYPFCGNLLATPKL